MSYSKWIGGGLGWAVGGPIGGLVGFALGALIDSVQGPRSEVRVEDRYDHAPGNNGPSVPSRPRAAMWPSAWWC